MQGIHARDPDDESVDQLVALIETVSVIIAVGIASDQSCPLRSRNDLEIEAGDGLIQLSINQKSSIYIRGSVWIVDISQRMSVIYPVQKEMLELPPPLNRLGARFAVNVAKYGRIRSKTASLRFRRPPSVGNEHERFMHFVFFSFFGVVMLQTRPRSRCRRRTHRCPRLHRCEKLPRAKGGEFLRLVPDVPALVSS